MQESVATNERLYICADQDGYQRLVRIVDTDVAADAEALVVTVEDAQTGERFRLRIPELRRVQAAARVG